MKKPNPLIIFVAVLASLLEIIDTSIVNVALPSMMGNLGAALVDISMVITGYAIANAVVLPVAAWMGDRIGRRRYYLGCIAAFTITSVACGLAPNLHFLIFFRILQGLAGGALLPTSQTLIYEQFPREKAGLAGAIFGMSVMIGPTLGPVVGGYLTDHLGWRSIFNVNLPLGIFALMLGMVAIQDRDKSEDTDPKPTSDAFDVIGLALLVSGIGCLQFVLERGDSNGWFESHLITGCALIALVCLPAFVWWESRVANPIIQVRLFKDAIVQNGVALQVLLGFFLYGVVFLLPVFAGQAYHYDATQIGMLFIPGALLTTALLPFIGRFMQAGVNPKKLILIGLVSLELCLFSMTFFSPLSSQSELYRMLFIRGFGLAFLFVPINSSILSQFTGATMGQISGLLNLFRQIGGSIGVALVATLLSKNMHQNYLDLSSKVSALDPATQHTVSGMSTQLGRKMVEHIGLGSKYEAALRLIHHRIQSQAFMLSFNQLVFVMMIVLSLSFIPLWRLKLKYRVTRSTKTGAH